MINTDFIRLNKENCVNVSNFSIKGKSYCSATSPKNPRE